MAQNPLKFIGFLIICGMFLTILLTASVIFKDLPSDSVKNLPKANIVDVKPPNGTSFPLSLVFVVEVIVDSTRFTVMSTAMFKEKTFSRLLMQ